MSFDFQKEISMINEDIKDEENQLEKLNSFYKQIPENIISNNSKKIEESQNNLDSLINTFDILSKIDKINDTSDAIQKLILLKSLLLGIDYINKKGIIHSDIKPENILIEYKGDSNDNNFEIKSVKIIDFGSAFFVNNTSAITSNTPEYLCPEITISNKKFIKELKNNNVKYINCVDIWSLGITFLELCLCCPTWMSYKTKVIINGKTYHSSGLFGCRGRDGGKIYQKQIELSKSIKKKLKNSMLYLFQQNDRDNFIDLLKKMLEFDYKKRITCQDAINHPFFLD